MYLHGRYVVNIFAYLQHVYIHVCKFKYVPINSDITLLSIYKVEIKNHTPCNLSAAMTVFLEKMNIVITIA
jgi:hypothetical protein